MARVSMVLKTDFLRPFLDARVYKEARTLLKAGHEVRILNWAEKGSGVPPEEESDGIRIIHVFHDIPPPPASRPVRMAAYLRHLGRMRDAICASRPDILHCHDLDTLTEGVLAKRRLKVPLVFDAHEDFAVMSHGYPFVVMAVRVFEPFLMGQVDRIITVNPVQEAVYRRFMPVTVIMNLAPRDFMERALERHPGLGRELVERYGLEGKTVVTYHGNLGHGKGVPELLESAARMLRRTDSVRFLVAGSGPGLEQYRREVGERGLDGKVVFTGPVPNDQIPVYLSISHVGYSVQRVKAFVVTTPVKVLESLAAGIPILANKEFPETKRLVGANDAGLLVGCDPDEIVAALDRLLDDPELRRRLGANGRRVFEGSLNWEAQERKLLGLYEELL